MATSLGNTVVRSHTVCVDKTVDLLLGAWWKVLVYAGSIKPSPSSSPNTVNTWQSKQYNWYKQSRWSLPGKILLEFTCISGLLWFYQVHDLLIERTRFLTTLTLNNKGKLCLFGWKLENHSKSLSRGVGVSLGSGKLTRYSQLTTLVLKPDIQHNWQLHYTI